ncbi:helix-turn-helix domain-containing protein [Marinobacter metalliresistant]|uniref:Helix-turn-helix domain-containing protein n=1 Tax=Marinobacter metalliresistant TaxID=2961995 RepID=A0ABZ2W4K8_9GAMM|tara:strand:+ start:597 stop:920 length:324 start_codon:yes stop_codon:yes gene_type:complete
MATTEPRSRILDEVRETATDLRKAGLISKRRLEEYEVLCRTNDSHLPAPDIRQIRLEARMSQAVFAAVLNVSVSSVQKWESGEKKPSGASLKLLHLVKRKGIEVLLY